MRAGSATFLLAAVIASSTLTGCLATTTKGTGGSDVAGSASLSAPPAQAAADLPRCEAPLGTLALAEGQYAGLSGRGLTSPMPVLRLMIQQSGCFNVVDRGVAIGMIQQEQQLTGAKAAASLVAAQYFLTPEIVFADDNAGGAGASIGTFTSLLPSALRGLAGSVAYDDQEVQTVLLLTQASSGLQVAAAEGSAQTRDVGITGSVLGAGFTSARFGGYADTAIGKTVVAALADAYAKLVRQLKAS
jgi:curli biogenesis system outer membrane secretion channel CsgG